jgi:hypothetical protein
MPLTTSQYVRLMCGHATRFFVTSHLNCDMVLPMNEKIQQKAENLRGRKPLGEAAMSAAERKRRSREQKRIAGAKEFSLRLEGLHLQHVEELAQHQNISSSAALRSILEPSLDRYVGVMRRCALLREKGASDEVIGAFIKEHLFPPLPDMDQLEAAPESN